LTGLDRHAHPRSTDSGVTNASLPLKRTTGLEPATFGLGSQWTTACQSQMDG
jgi:hypothetical protein